MDQPHGPETSQHIQVWTEFTPMVEIGPAPWTSQPTQLITRQSMQEVGQGPVSIYRYSLTKESFFSSTLRDLYPSDRAQISAN
jgi:hypothetical protein